jgi:hypothetical protein
MFSKILINKIYYPIQNVEQSQPNDLIRRSGSLTTTLHHHCPPDPTPKVRTVKRDMNQKLSRKDYEIKTLKQVCSITQILILFRFHLGIT